MKYLIGKGYEKDKDYPYCVEYDFENKEKPLVLWHGKGGQGRSGGQMELERINRPSIKKHFYKSNAEWFLPFIDRMLKGEPVTIEEIETKHQQIFGKPLVSV